MASDKEVKVSPIREAFQSALGKATVFGLASQAGSVAEQPVGFAAARLAANERIQNLQIQVIDRANLMEIWITDYLKAIICTLPLTKCMANIDEAGSRLEVHRRGEYQGFVT